MYSFILDRIVLIMNLIREQGLHRAPCLETTQGSMSKTTLVFRTPPPQLLTLDTFINELRETHVFGK